MRVSQNHHIRVALVTLAIIAGAVLALASLGASPAFACTPPPGGLPVKTVTDRVNAADIALEGTVIAFTGEAFMGNQVAKIRVDQYLKGDGPAVVTVSRYGTGGLCLSEVTNGRHGLFYVVETATGLQASYLTQFDAIGNADEATLAEASIASGHPPTPPDPRTVAIGAGVTRDENNAAAIAQAVDSVAARSAPAKGTAASVAVTLLASVGLVVARGRTHRTA